MCWDATDPSTPPSICQLGWRAIVQVAVTISVQRARKATLSLVAADASNRVAHAARRLERLQPQVEEARRELHAAIRAAADEGVDQASLARLAGLSRERVRQILAAR
jgi:hypothetical protein